MPEADKLKELPVSIQNLVQHGVQLTKPKKVILFGSRARRDFHENSDYDIAFLGLASPEKWVNLKSDYYEEPITLLKVDLLIYEEASLEYRNKIDREGFLLYEFHFYRNFAVAFNKLSEFSQQVLQDDLDKAGLIQGFEFTFEQCWKSIQKAAGNEGVRIASPKYAFSWAIEKGWILSQNETTWLSMLEDRNLTTHTYREEIANSVVANIQNKYVQAFKELLEQMKS